MVALGLDYSAGSIPGATIRAAGYQFVIRYAGTPGRAKNISRAEYQDLIAHGVQTWLVYENSVNDIKGGYPGGVAAAKTARADATSVGYPASSPIFFCADRHLTATEVALGVQYIKGAASFLGHDATGAYGFSEFIYAVKTGGVAAYYWQCGNRNTLIPGVHLYQRQPPYASVGGISCDVNEQLLLIGISSPPAPVPTAPAEEDDMSGALLRYAKGDALPNIYLVRYGMGDDGTPAESRRAVGSTEWAILSQLGARCAVLPQKQFDAIPILKVS